MIIRAADLDCDMPALVKGAREFAERFTPFMALPDDDGMVEVIARLATINGVEMLVNEHEGRVVGGAAMLYAPYLWNPSTTVAEELFWSTFQGAPMGTSSRLLDEIMMRAHEHGAVPMLKALVTSSPGVERAYRRRGLSPVETVFTRVS
jgi:hypothetical protein